MTSEMTTRTYRMKRRAESQEQTRLRITESAVELHGTVGPYRTSVSAVADRAGVRRSTVYRHFPDESALFDACSAHWAAANPPPDLGAWAAIADPEERLRAALGEVGAYYGRTERMLDNLFRDEPNVPQLQPRLAGLRWYLDAATDTLLKGRGLRGAARSRTRAAIAHAIAFSTWKSLVREQNLPPADFEALMRALVAAARRPGA